MTTSLLSFVQWDMCLCIYDFSIRMMYRVWWVTNKYEIISSYAGHYKHTTCSTLHLLQLLHTTIVCYRVNLRLTALSHLVSSCMCVCSVFRVCVCVECVCLCSTFVGCVECVMCDCEVCVCALCSVCHSLQVCMSTVFLHCWHRTEQHQENLQEQRWTTSARPERKPGPQHSSSQLSGAKRDVPVGQERGRDTEMRGGAKHRQRGMCDSAVTALV